MKKIISYISAVVLLASGFSITSVYADTNNNVNLLISKKVTLGITEPTSDIISKCDINSDNIINTLDIIELKNSILNSSNIDLSTFSLVSGYDNLYDVMSLKTTSYSDFIEINTINNNLLIVKTFSDENSEDVSYELSLYDINAQKEVSTLKNVFFNEYSIVDNQIFLYNSTEKVLTIYDENFNVVNTYDFSSILNTEWVNMYTYGSKSSIYIYDNENCTFYNINLNGKDFTYSTFEMPYNTVYIHGISDDGNNILLTGRNNSTLRDEVLSWNIKNNSVNYSNYIGNDYVDSTSNNNFLISTIDDNNISYIQNSKGSTYYKTNSYDSMKFNNDDNIIATNSNQNNATIDIFNQEGSNLATLKYSGNTLGKGYDYINVSSIKQIGNTPYYYLLTSDFNSNYNVLLWDSSNSKSSQTWETVSNYTSVKSMVGTNEDFSSLYSKAESIGEKYGINIYIADTVTSDVFKSTGYSVEQLLDVSITNSALSKLDNILSVYPEDFFKQLYLGNTDQLNIYISSEIKGNDTEHLSFASGFVTQNNNICMMVVDANSYDSWEDTINHELSHIIDFRLEQYSEVHKDAPFSEDTWNSYNPSGFEYQQSYTDYWNNSYNEKYFVSSYSTTFPTEDRAELLGYAMNCYFDTNIDRDFISINSPRGKKLEYYFKCIRESFDTSTWSTTTPWEEVLSSTNVSSEYVFPFNDGDVYTIKNLGSGKYINVDYGKDVNGTNVYQWTGDGSTEQKFKMDLYQNSYRIRAMSSSNGTDKTLDIVKSNGNVISGANVEIYEPVDDIAQEWLFVEVQDGVYKIVPKYNTKLALSVYGNDNGTASGTSSTSKGNVFVSTYTGADSQKWIITKVG